MKFKIERYEIGIIPECPEDEAYLEEVLGLYDGGAQAEAVRVNAIGLNCMGYVKISKRIVPPKDKADPAR